MMTKAKKIERALNALDKHIGSYEEEGYHPIIPQRLRNFWKTGEAFQYDGLCLPKRTALPGWEAGSTFRLNIIAPMWDNMLLGLDDGVVGPIGDWEQAYNYLPIFVGGVQADFCIVVQLDQKHCPVGLFEEGFSAENENTPNGIYPLSPSLDAFLATLTNFEADVAMDLDESSKEEGFLAEDEY